MELGMRVGRPPGAGSFEPALWGLGVPVWSPAALWGRWSYPVLLARKVRPERQEAQLPVEPLQGEEGAVL